MTKPTQNKPDPWGDFWSNNARAGGGGCLPDAYQSINEAQCKVWMEFGRTLPGKVRILDLATGDGRVMAWLLRARPKAKLTGCDLAPTLPPPPNGTKVRTGVPMEDLPYHANMFDAVTSQFGFEYGETELVAREIARVLKPSGIIGLLTHRADGPILAHNLARRDQLQWALDERGVISLARKSLALKRSGIVTVPDGVVAAVRDGAATYGAQSPAWEIAEAVRQTLVLGAHDSAANLTNMLDLIAAKAANELGRIASLEAACSRTGNAAEFASGIAEGGLRQTDIRVLTTPQATKPFAHFRIMQHAV